MDSFDETFPEFLRHLDGDPDYVCREFVLGAYPRLEATRFRVFQPYDEDRVGIWNLEIIEHFVGQKQIERRFPVLRTFKDEGRPFARWFLHVACMKAIDIWRRQAREDQTHEPIDEGDGSKRRGTGDSPDDNVIGPKEEALRDENKRIFTRCIGKLQRRCQVAIVMRYSDGRSNADIARVLRLGDNKIAGDFLRNCRVTMRRCLEGNGYRREIGIPPRDQETSDIG